MSVLVVGIDPGSITGIGILSANAVVDAWQDEPRPALRRLVQWLRENRAATSMIGVEDAFMGKGPHASLHVARAGGFCEGVLFSIGYPESNVIRLHPSKWRSEISIKGKDRDAKEAHARVIAEGMCPRRFSKGETHMAEALCMAQVTWNTLARSHNSSVWRNNSVEVGGFAG